MSAEYVGSAAVHYWRYGEVGEYQLHWCPDGSGEIWAFEVYPQHQGKGHAKAMMREIIERCGHQRLSLLVKQDNPIAIELYRQFGFEIVEIDDPRHEFRMRRPT